MIRNPLLRTELLARAALDQAVRNQVVNKWPGATPVDTNDALFKLWRRVDLANTSRLREVVNRHGWPGITLVGTDAAHAAWLLAQHADDSPAFQRHCLQLMSTAVDAGEAAARDLAYLVDRVAVHEGRPQIYGTQHRWSDCGAVPDAMEAPEAVDARRQAMGLRPLAEDTAAINIAYRQAPPPPYLREEPAWGQR